MGTFNATGDMTNGRVGHTATLLTNGRVLIAGGFDKALAAGGLALASAELYDPSTGTVSATENMTEARGGHTATVLADGRVLITGGGIGVFRKVGEMALGLTSAEIYNPSTGTFTSTGRLNTPRSFPTATLLADGTVLVAGSISNPYPSVTDSAEIYRPAVLIAPPALSLSGDGKGQGAILHAGTAQVASSSSPATAEEALQIYLTGLADGSVIPPHVVIGGRMAEVLFFGKAPAFAGLDQVNVRVPSGIAPGDAVPVRLKLTTGFAKHGDRRNCPRGRTAAPWDSLVSHRILRTSVTEV